MKSLLFARVFFSNHPGAGAFPDKFEKFSCLMPLPNERLSYSVQLDITKRAHITLGVYVTAEGAIQHLAECKMYGKEGRYVISSVPYHEKSYLVGGIPPTLYFNMRPPHTSLRYTSDPEINFFLKNGVNLNFSKAYIWSLVRKQRLTIVD